MKKLGMVLGAAAVAVVAGCKDPDFRRANAPVQNEAKDAAPVEAATPPPPPPPQEVKVVEAPRCTCPPGTRHASPCLCGAADCMCIVTPKPVPVKPAEPEHTVYVVQNGDYLAKVSKRFNVTIQSIKRMNGLKSDVIRVGQKLKIPGKFDVGEQKAPVVRKAPAAKPAKAAAAYTGATKEYVVKNGDTLGAVAYGHGVNIRQLKALNGLSGDVLKVGQKLKVPAEKAERKPGAKAAAEKPAAAKPEKPAEPKAEAKAPAPAPAAQPAAASEAPAPAAEAAAPAETPAAAEAAPAEPATFTYTVKEGEDITAILVKFGVSASEIRELNNLGESDTLKAGQTIRLPKEAQQ